MNSMKSSKAVVCTLLVLSLFASQAVAAESDKPNILFIMADDLGYGDLGSYGQSFIQTPNLDKMAKEGLRFTDYYAGSPVCAPSRSALMTGQHTGHTRVRGNFGKNGVVGLAGGKGRVPLYDHDVTIAEILREAGYVTAITGKWGLGEPGTPGHPNDQGFDEWFGYLNQRRAHNYYPEYLWRNREKVEMPGNLNGKRGTYSHDLFTDFAMDFIYQHKDQPFFLYLAYTIPHAQYEIPDAAPYTHEPWTDDEKVHAAMITRMDRDIGRLFDLLKRLDLDARTIVFFSSDNGAANRWEGRFDSSGVLRGRKRHMYDGGIRSPMIVRWPGQIKVGNVDATPWYIADVLPTLAALASAKVPDHVNGVNVLPVILGQRDSLEDRFLYWEFFESGFKQAVRWNNWKAIRPKLGEPLELYDLSSDAGEMDNIAGKYPKVIRHIERYLETARSPSKHWPVAELD